MKKKIKVIFSDLFGVLIGPDYSDLINYIIKTTNQPSDEIYKNIFDEENMRLLRGEISYNQYFSSLQYKINHAEKLNYAKCKYFWDHMKIGPMPVIKNLLDMKNNYKIYILTNTTREHINKLKSNFFFIDAFDGIITSDLSKSSKPNNMFFNYACSTLNVDPHESIFIDDSKMNIIAAEKLGMTTHLYQNYADFNKFISRFL